MKHAEFTHLHLHTQYSLLDGANRLDALLAKAEAHRYPALAITDHGNLYGAVKFYKKARAHGIKPILGCEVYVAQGSRFDRTPHSRDGAVGLNHMVLLVQDETGYRNLLALVSKSHLESFYYKPRVDRELLERHAEGLIATTSCLNGEVPQLLLSDDEERAERAARYYAELFAGRYYVELQDHGLPEQKKILPGLVRLARKLDLPLIATNDCHYLEAPDAFAHEVLLCIQTGKTIKDPNRWRFQTDQLYVKSPQEMEALFGECPDALRNTLEVAERCNLELEFGGNHLPRYVTPDGSSLDDFLARLARKGLERRLETDGLAPGVSRAEYEERLASELEIIRKMGYSGYFLIVWDFIDHARRGGMPVGPGRGSAAGSLVAYSIGVTGLDPIRYRLIFERFLNPERVTMPDIDIDFCMERRDEVIEYVTEKYGRENVSQIITFGSMMAKGVIRDVGRAMDMPYGEVDRIAKCVPGRLNITLDEALKEEPRLREAQKSDPRVAELLDTARTLEGLSRHASTHAAGVVIAPRPLMEVVPLARGANGETVTQYDMVDVESLGLLKMDFLGLKTLTVIRRAEEMIRAGAGKGEGEPDFDIERVPVDDAETYRIFSEGRTAGVFQCESRGMREVLRKMKPTTFEDVIAAVALYRPGPLGSGMVDDFIQRKHGKVPTEYELPQLEEILRETYGVIVYQEQVMQIASRMAGFSLGAADLLRRAMGKKKPEEMARQQENFLKGCAERGLPADKAKRIFERMAHFAGYGFNKSHSAAYALVAYWTAYLKAHYPRAFMAALLTCDMDNTDKVMKNIAECREMGIPVLPPDINESGKQFTVHEEGIRFGLAAVKNVGASAVDEILRAREEEGRFPSLFAFCQRVDLRHLNRRVVESLIKCGAFDSTGARRAQLMAVLDTALESAAQAQRDRITGQTHLFGEENGGAAAGDPPLPLISEWGEKELLAQEKEALGFFITGHPLARFKRELKLLTTVSTAGLAELPGNRKVRLGGLVGALRVQTTRRGDLMARFHLEDLEGFAEVIVFPDCYREASPLLEREEPILLEGTAEPGENGVTVKAEKITPLSEEALAAGKGVSIRLSVAGKSRELIRARLIDLKEILDEHRGTFPLTLRVDFGGRQEERRFRDFGVDPSGEMIERTEALLGERAVQME
ncbi:MAG: DNA polymerase III subunit alpha [Nitrospinota bacterium]